MTNLEILALAAVVGLVVGLTATAQAYFARGQAQALIHLIKQMEQTRPVGGLPPDLQKMHLETQARKVELDAAKHTAQMMQARMGISAGMPRVHSGEPPRARHTGG